MWFLSEFPDFHDDSSRYRLGVKKAFAAGLLRDFHRLPVGDTAAALDRQPVDRSRLANGLHNYLKRLSAPKETLLNAGLLADSNTKVVITGQQAGLFTGPAYTIYKAITAINLARQLTTKDFAVVPVFWIASQDHDTKEVSEAKLLDLEEKLFDIRLDLPKGLPVGRIKVQNQWINQVNMALNSFIGPYKNVFQAELASFATDSFSDWFAKQILYWLGKHGLVVIDPLDEEIAPLFADYLYQEIENPLKGPRLIEESGNRLLDRGFTPQLKRSPQSTNLFVEENDGQRRLLRFDGKHFLTNHQYTSNDLREIVKNQPSRITPAAGLRPILQDLLFNTNISVLGPGELAYHLQIQDIYKEYGTLQPLLWPRMSITWLEPPIKRILNRYNLDSKQYSDDPEMVLQELFLQRSGLKGFLEGKTHSLKEIFAEIQDKIDPTLAEISQKSEQRILNQIEHLKSKIAKNLLEKENIADHQFDRLRKHLVPGMPQERFYSFSSYFLKFGPYIVEKMLKLKPEGDYWLEID